MTDETIPTLIPPTYGRLVNYFEAGQSYPEGRAALITLAHNDREVNLTVFERSGYTRGVTNVLLIQPGDALPPGTAFWCEWPSHTIMAAAARPPVDYRAVTPPAPDATPSKRKIGNVNINRIENGFIVAFYELVDENKGARRVEHYEPSWPDVINFLDSLRGAEKVLDE